MTQISNIAAHITQKEWTDLISNTAKINLKLDIMLEHQAEKNKEQNSKIILLDERVNILEHSGKFKDGKVSGIAAVVSFLTSGVAIYVLQFFTKG